MVERFAPKKLNKERLLAFLNKSIDNDFYITSNNQRVFSFHMGQLNDLLKNSATHYSIGEGEYSAFGLLWKARGGEVSRHYIKLKADDVADADKVLTCILWNANVKEIYCKVNKDSKFYNLFTGKGFRWCHGRGKEILLCKTLLERKKSAFKVYDKDRDSDNEKE